MADATTSRLIHAACADLHRHVAAESVDLILTDPPYAPDTLPCYRDLADFAAYSLKDGGNLVAMSGTPYLPTVMEYLSNNGALTYHWTLNYMLPGANMRFHARAVRQGWKPVLWFVKGKPDGINRIDVVHAPPLSKQDNRYHKWGQNPGGFMKLITPFVNPGQLVCDPFVGGGTTAIVARAVGCNFIGADTDAECLEITTQRLKDDCPLLDKIYPQEIIND